MLRNADYKIEGLENEKYCYFLSIVVIFIFNLFSYDENTLVIGKWFKFFGFFIGNHYSFKKFSERETLVFGIV